MCAGAGLALVEAVAFCPFQQGVQRVGGVIDALVQVAELGEAVRVKSNETQGSAVS
jgi:hypothetical protein